jgi:hypothetical protein
LLVGEFCRHNGALLETVLESFLDLFVLLLEPLKKITLGAAISALVRVDRKN